MKLITEVNEELEVFEIDEGSNGKKSLYLEGVFLQSETVNRNKRSYPRNILEREVKRYNKDYIKENRAFGELGHPEGPTINLERVSHMVTNLRRSGNDWIRVGNPDPREWRNAQSIASGTTTQHHRWP